MTWTYKNNASKVGINIFYIEDVLDYENISITEMYSKASIESQYYAPEIIRWPCPSNTFLGHKYRYFKIGKNPWTSDFYVKKSRAYALVNQGICPTPFHNTFLYIRNSCLLITLNKIFSPWTDWKQLVQGGFFIPQIALKRELPAPPQS